MERMTRHKDQWECRIGECCIVEDWMEIITKTYPRDWDCSPCDICPFEKYINRLAELEDIMENQEDDLK